MLLQTNSPVWIMEGCPEQVNPLKDIYVGHMDTGCPCEKTPLKFFFYYHRLYIHMLCLKNLIGEAPSSGSLIYQENGSLDTFSTRWGNSQIQVVTEWRSGHTFVWLFLFKSMGETAEPAKSRSIRRESIKITYQMKPNRF